MLRAVYATGLSDGGLMDFRLACGMSDRIAAIAPLAPRLPKDLSEHRLPTRPVPLLMVDGTADPLVPYRGGTATANADQKISVLGAEESAKTWSNSITAARRRRIFGAAGVQRRQGNARGLLR